MTLLARFSGGSQDGSVRSDAVGAYFVVPIPRPQCFTAQEAIDHMNMHWKDRPLAPCDVEIYKRTVERDHVSGKLIGIVYTYERTERPGHNGRATL